jgi:hypothetical protein
MYLIHCCPILKALSGRLIDYRRHIQTAKLLARFCHQILSWERHHLLHLIGHRL